MSISVVFAGLLTLVALTFGGWLLFTEQRPPDEASDLADVIAIASFLAAEAEDINAEWDEVEGVLPTDERNVMFRETLARLQEVQERTGQLVVEATRVAGSGTRAELESTVLSLVEDLPASADEMIAGLNEPRGLKQRRLDGLDSYLRTAEELRRVLE